MSEPLLTLSWRRQNVAYALVLAVVTVLVLGSARGDADSTAAAAVAVTVLWVLALGLRVTRATLTSDALVLKTALRSRRIPLDDVSVDWAGWRLTIRVRGTQSIWLLAPGSQTWLLFDAIAELKEFSRGTTSSGRAAGS